LAIVGIDTPYGGSASVAEVVGHICSVKEKPVIRVGCEAEGLLVGPYVDGLGGTFAGIYQQAYKASELCSQKYAAKMGWCFHT
jgi:hypothetical protein